eukprot:696968-Rhodomonas_salina.3
MTGKAWAGMTPNQISGIRALPYIAENPDWWCMEILDCFQSWGTPCRCWATGAAPRSQDHSVEGGSLRRCIRVSHQPKL